MIKTKELNAIIHKILYKPLEQPLTEFDVLKITEIVLDKYDINNSEIKYDYSDFNLLKNLENIYFNEFLIDDNLIKIINTLPRIKYLTFEHCIIQANIKINNNIEMIILAHTEFENLNIFSELETLESLEILAGEKVNVEELTMLRNLESLYLEETKIVNFQKIKELHNLEDLVLDGSTVDDLNMLEYIKNKVNLQMEETFHLQ